MFIGSATAQQISSVVWAAATRALTNLGALVTAQQQNNASIAAGTTVDFRPSAGKMRHVSLTQIVNAAGTYQVGYYDGTTFVPVVNNTGQNIPAAFEGYSGVTTGLALKNGTASSGVYSWAALDWTL